MKLKATLFFLLFFIIHSYSQNLSVYTISFNQTPLKEAIDKLEEQSDYRFFYLDDWIKDIKVSGDYNSKSLNFIVNDLLKNSVLNYYLSSDNKVILSKNMAINDKFLDEMILSKDTLSTPVDIIPKPILPPKKEEVVAADKLEDKNKTDDEIKRQPSKIVSEKVENIGKEDVTKQQTKFTLSGYVVDDKTGNPLENVAVRIKGTTQGTSTNKQGFYTLKLNKGTYTILTRSINTIPYEQRVNVFNNGTLNFSLLEKTESLREVVIQADVDKNVREVITGVTKIEVEEIKNIPLVLGERDIIKVATTLPGITTTGEGSNGFNVRGGKTDQNLILLDNASIYNPSHFFGIFSAINPFTTGGVNIYKGHIPAEYGGRLSSVFNINSKDARTDKIGGEVSIGPVTGNVTIELPVVKEKSGLMVGARSTYSEWILRSLDEESLKNSEASFFDVIAKYNHDINENNEIKATGYYSKDRFSITNDSLFGYSNQLASLGWKHTYNDKLQSNLTLTTSGYDFNIEFDGDFNRDFDLNYRNSETELKLKFDHNYNKTIDLTYGIASKLYKIQPGEIEPLNGDSDIVPLTIETERGLESAIFASANIELSEKLAIDVGLRYSLYAFLGGSTQRIYEPNLPKSESTLIEERETDKGEFVETFNGLEGRISARYFLAEDLSLKASFNNTFQYIHTLSSNTTVSPFDTWKLSDLNVDPQQAQQLSLGLFKNFSDNMYEVSLEGYYKNYDNILDYKVGAQLLLNETLETQVLQGEGRSYGIEFLVRKNGGRFNGWLGYTYSRTELKMDSEFAEERINSGNYFPANYDKPHDFSAVINYKMTKRFSFSGNFVYQTGRPITYPVGTFVFNNSEFTLYSDRNKFRIPDYYRLDVGFNYEGNHKRKKAGHGFWNLSIYNVFGRNNPYSVFFVTEDGQIKALQSSIFAIPVPTLTYNFKF